MTMKRIIAAVFLVAGLAISAFAANVKDKMTYEGPVTFKGAMMTAHPNAVGTIPLDCVASHDFGSVAGNWTLTAAEAQCSYFVFTNVSSTTASIIKPTASPGKIHTLKNTGGKTVTFKVTGQSGGTIANAKTAVYVDNGTDVVEIIEQP